MIDLATGWIEMHTVLSARADLVANQVELAWLTRYPTPHKVIVDRGNEFLVSARYFVQKIGRVNTLCFIFFKICKGI